MKIKAPKFTLKLFGYLSIENKRQMDPSTLNLQQLRAAVEALSSGVPQRISETPSHRAPRFAEVQAYRSRGSGRLFAFVLVFILLACALCYFMWTPSKAEHHLGLLNAAPQSEHAARTPEAPFAWDEIDAKHINRAAPIPIVPAQAPEKATREDLIQFAKDHAAFYAAQGVPEQEAMVYITNKVRQVVEQQKQEQVVQVVEAVPAPKKSPLPAPMPLVLKLSGPVPTSDGLDELDTSGRRKKVSSEGKEVEEYMKRRQNALGVTESQVTSEARTSVSFHDPGETML